MLLNGDYYALSDFEFGNVENVPGESISLLIKNPGIFGLVSEAYICYLNDWDDISLILTYPSDSGTDVYEVYDKNRFILNEEEIKKIKSFFNKSVDF